MEAYFDNPGIILAVLVAIIFCGAVYYRSRKTKKRPAYQSKNVDGGNSEGQEEVSPDIGEPVDARVYDNVTRTAYNDEISAEIANQIRATHGNLGRKWLRDGAWRYAFVKKLDTEGHEVYNPVIVISTLNYPPPMLGRALLQKAVDVYYDLTSEKTFMEQWGKFLMFGGVVIFLMWLLAAK